MDKQKRNVHYEKYPQSRKVVEKIKNKKTSKLLF